MLTPLKTAAELAFCLLPLCLTSTTPALADPWTRQCFGPAGTEAERCSIQQIVKVDGQVAMTASFGSADPGAVPRGVVTVPLNTKLGNGLAIRIDEKPQTILQYDFCSRQGCRANIEVGERLLRNLETGKLLYVTWVALDGKPVQLRFELNGFSTAWNSVINRR